MFETKAKKGDQVIILPMHWKYELLDDNKFCPMFGEVLGQHETKNPDGSISLITEAITKNGNIYNNDETFWLERSVEIYTPEEFREKIFSIIEDINGKIEKLEQQRKNMAPALCSMEDMKRESENDRYFDY